MNHHLFLRMTARKYVVLTGLMFLCLLPFAGTLEIHHVFAEVDHDGHEHSDFDVCQWVQQHANGVFVLEKPLADVLPLDILSRKTASNTVFIPYFVRSVQSPRPPPSSYSLLHS